MYLDLVPSAKATGTFFLTFPYITICNWADESVSLWTVFLQQVHPLPMSDAVFLAYQRNQYLVARLPKMTLNSCDMCLHTCEEHRETAAGGGTQIMLCPAGATTGATSPSKTHRPTQEGAPGHRGRWGNPNNAIREMRSLPRLHRGASASWARHDTQHHGSRGAASWSTPQTEGCHCLGYGTQYGMQGRSILGLHKTYHGMLKGGTTGREREGSRTATG